MSPSTVGNASGSKIPYRDAGKEWRPPSERIRTASEILIEVDLTNEDVVPIYIKISNNVLHLRRLGMTYPAIANRLGVNLWTAKKAAPWGKAHQEKRKSPSH